MTHGPATDGRAGPLRLEDYERSPELVDTELQVIKRPASSLERNALFGRWYKADLRALHRLLAPLDDLEKLASMPEGRAHGIRKLLVIEMARRGTSYWSWSQADWAEMICRTCHAFGERYHVIKGARLHVMAFAYAVGGVEQPRTISDALVPYLFACAAFGRESVDDAVSTCSTVLERWGTGKWFLLDRLQPGVSEVLIAARTPRLNQMTTEVLKRAWRGTHRELRAVIVHISRVLTEMSIIPQPIIGAFETPREGVVDTAGAPAMWTKWARRWYDTSTLEPHTRKQYLRVLVNVGRWLERTQPGVVEPSAWTRSTGAACVAAIDRLRVGDWAGPDPRHLAGRRGKPLMPRSKVGYLRGIRAFFRDCQEWEWCQLRFIRSDRLPYPAAWVCRSVLTHAS